MKKALFVLLLLALVVGTLGCNGEQAQPADEDEVEEITFSMGSAYAEGVILNDVLVKFKELLEAKSDGKVTVELFLAGSLGSDEDIMQSVTAGAIEGQAVGGVLLSNYAPKFMFIDAPFTMKDWDHILALWESELGDKLRETVVEAGNTTLAAPVFRGYRHFTANKPVAVPDDLKGLKLRLPVLQTWITVFDTLGASIVPIPLNELYTALATGTAEAAEGDVAQIYGHKLNEVQSHLSLTGHSVGIGFITFNAEWLNGLNEDTRNMVLEAAEEAAGWASAEMVTREKEVIDQLADLGMEVVEADRDALAAAVMPIMEGIFETEYTVTTAEEVLSYAK